MSYLRSGLAGFGASGITTHAARFLMAQQSNISEARTLVDQAYVHAFQQNIPDKAAWQSVWNAMYARANATLKPYMSAKLGSPAPAPSSVMAPSTPPPPPTAPYQPVKPPTPTLWQDVITRTATPKPPPVAAQTVVPMAPPTQLAPVAVPVPAPVPVDAGIVPTSPSSLVANISPAVLVGLGVGALLLVRGRRGRRGRR